jgi:hypothetical protein
MNLVFKFLVSESQDTPQQATYTHVVLALGNRTLSRVTVEPGGWSKIALGFLMPSLLIPGWKTQIPVCCDPSGLHYLS